jgi:hypothetical protein
MPEETASPNGSPKEPRSAWSPTGIAIVSLLLSPLPGGVLHALNYARLGNPGRRRLALFSNLITATVLLFPSLPPGFRISASLFAAAYFYKTQEQLFLAHRSGGGRKASLAVPVVLTIAAALALLVVFFLAGAR